jgi:hydroxyacyl-ACP dehydratase HTD2-like protein with hotdog domain
VTDLSLSLALDEWAPEPVESVETITSGPAVALAGVLDTEPPVTGPGDPLPPLWHWLYFLDRPAQRELGPDGHPAAGRFTPPVQGLRRMHAGGRVTYQAPHTSQSAIRCGDELVRRSELADWRIRQGRSGELLFVTLRHSFRRAGTLVAAEEQDLVYRSGPAPGSLPDSASAVPDFEWRLDVTPDPVLLFRFSALTYNSHRIHYDAAYATGVEGHPGLVVQGPLLAILCLEVVRHHLPGRSVTELAFRARSPLYAGDLLTVSGGPSDGGLSDGGLSDGGHAGGECELRVTGPRGREAMTARARLTD